MVADGEVAMRPVLVLLARADLQTNQADAQTLWELGGLFAAPKNDMEERAKESDLPDDEESDGRDEESEIREGDARGLFLRIQLRSSGAGRWNVVYTLRAAMRVCRPDVVDAQTIRCFEVGYRGRGNMKCGFSCIRP